MREEVAVRIGNYSAGKVTDFDDRWGGRFRWFLSGLFIGNLIYLVGLYLVGLREDAINYFSNIYLIIPLFGGSFGLIRLYQARKAQQPVRHTYRVAVALFCSGLLLWSIGCAIGMGYYYKYHKGVDFPWWGDVFFGSCFICWFVGISRLYELANLNLLKELKDALLPLLIVIWGAIVSLMFYFHRGSLSTHSTKTELFAFGCDIFFPIIDLLNLSLLVTLLPGQTNKHLGTQVRSRLHIIVIGYAFLCLASLSFYICNNLPSDSPYAYYNGGFTDAMFATAFTILSIGMSLISLSEETD